MGGTSLFRVGDAVELWRVLLHLSVLVACLLLFEHALHHLEGRAAVSAKYQQLLSKAYRELMILGLIGLGLKLLKEAPSVDGDSATMTAFQVADLTIFILALALILQAVCIFLLLRKHNVRADRAELFSTADLADAVASPSGINSWVGDTKELIQLRLLRHLFLSRFQLPQLFPFAKYLRQAQNNQITHMTDVGAPMWAVLLIVAWGLEGITEVLTSGEPELTRRRGLVFVLVGFSWALLALHSVVLVYFRSCVQQLLQAAGLSEDQSTLTNHLRSIAREEARAWTQEDAGNALLIIQRVQEQHELPRQKLDLPVCESKLSLKCEVAPQIKIPWFSRKSWHFTVMLLLMLNGFYLALVVQCVAYQVSIYADLRLVEVLAIPLPLVLNTLILQPRIFRNFVLVSSIFLVDGITLSEVVSHFREIIELRSEFAILLWENMQAKKLTIGDLHAELDARDPSRSGVIEIENLRVMLRVFGLRLSSFRFNSVARLLFELKDMRIEYNQLIRLVALAQSEALVDCTGSYENMVVRHHPLLLQSVLSEEEEEPGQVTIRENSYLPPHPLLGATTTSTRTVLSDDCKAAVHITPPPMRPQLKRIDSKFLGMSSSTLHDLFHIEGTLDLGMAAPAVDGDFAHM